jgi:titin
MCKVDLRKKCVSFILSLALILSLAVSIVPQTILADVGQELLLGPYERIVTDSSGRQLIQAIYPLPPPKTQVDMATVPDAYIEEATTTLSDVPSFDWSYGCSATSAAMLFGYYDRIGYGNMYTGSTNGGVCPLDNSIWGHTAWPSVICGECPLSATHKGVDGRAIRGHVDDYWINYGNAGPDPYLGNWAEHTLGDCTSDYMGTNQAKYGNIDGGTTFFYYSNGDPLYDYTGSEPASRDGCHGMKLFAQSRGYTVLTNFSQLIKGQGTDPNKGFTFADFQAEIDAGRPVLIHVTGHTMLGYGYDTSTNTIYVHNTWDYDNHQMTWGGTYSGMQHRAVSVIRLSPSPLSTPSNLTPFPISSSQIDLTWQDNSSDETGFKIERKTGSGSYSQIATVVAGVTSYSSTGLSASTTYYYRVRAYNAGGNSDYSNEASAMTLAAAPVAPTLKSPANGSTVPTLTPKLEWNAASGAVSYGLQVSVSSSFTNLLVNEAEIAILYYDIAPATLNWNTTYYWRVNARDSFDSVSSWSSYRYFETAVGPPPETPSNLTALAISSNWIDLTWQDNSSDETGFKIERKTGSGSYSQIAAIGAGVTIYSNSGLSAGTTYYYQVRAYNAAGNSEYSNEASATTLPPPPSAPTLKSPASGATVPNLTPRLEWNTVSGAVSYGIQIATSSSFANLLVSETGITNLYYDIAPATFNWNTTYYWRVNAIDVFNSTSSWSSYRYFKTAIGPPPDAPSHLIATPVSSSRIDLTWQDNSGDETGFKIERKTGSGSYSQIATIGADVTSYSSNSLRASTTYYYRLRAYKGTLNSNYCEESSATTLPPPPSAPTLKLPASRATLPNLTARLEWNAPTGAVSYAVQVSTTSSFTNLLVSETGITDLYYDIAPALLNWNTTYYWRVNASNNFSSTSRWSSYRYFKTAVGPPPEAPSNLVATPVSSSKVDLIWQDNSNDETGFKIERKIGSGSYSQIATVVAGVTSYSNTSLRASTAYSYRVRTYKGTLNSDYCEESSATTLPPPPAAPTLKSPASASTVPNLTPRLEWNASTGAVSYGVQVATSSSFANLIINETIITNLYYDIASATLNWNTTYYWRVNASNSFNSTSSWSGNRYFKTATGP